MKYVAIILLLGLCSCASVTHEEFVFNKEGNIVGKTKDKYKRIGSQKVGGFKFIKTADGATIELNNQEGGAGDLGVALKNATGAVYNLSKKGMGIP